jgi:hypothetical protein
MKAAGAKRALATCRWSISFAYDGACKRELAAAIELLTFSIPMCPVYQNVATAVSFQMRSRKSNHTIDSSSKVDAICATNDC